LTPTAFNIGNRRQNLADILNTVTGSRVIVEMFIPEDACIVRADVSQFETALVNMAVNARDAMDAEGQPRITLSCSTGMPAIRGHAATSGAFVAISLTDTGSGIAPADLARVFEPFVTTKAVGKGTGLGLSQVFGFARQSGGDVDVESKPGDGTTFTLYLPQLDDETAVEAVADTAGRPSLEHGLCILVVEDNIEVGGVLYRSPFRPGISNRPRSERRSGAGAA
jgi:signal transduction histidine kinase